MLYLLASFAVWFLAQGVGNKYSIQRSCILSPRGWGNNRCPICTNHLTPRCRAVIANPEPVTQNKRLTGEARERLPSPNNLQHMAARACRISSGTKHDCKGLPSLLHLGLFAAFWKCEEATGEMQTWPTVLTLNSSTCGASCEWDSCQTLPLRTCSSVSSRCSENPGCLSQARQLPVASLCTTVACCNCTGKMWAFICSSVLNVDTA